MQTSVLNFVKQNAGKALLSATLLASSFANAQGPRPGYAYIGSCTVNGQAHYYYASLTQATWPAANTAAMNMGGYLATLTSQQENDCVFTNYVNYLTTSGMGRPTIQQGYGDPRNPWIGLTDVEQEGNFQWVNGENCSDFRNWDCGTVPGPRGLLCEPNNITIGESPNGEDYVQLLTFSNGPDNSPGGLGRKNAGKWNDWFNIESQYYIVEFGTSSCVCTPVPRQGSGCSHGYWKNAQDASWTGAGYSRTASFMTTFGITNDRGVVTSGTTLQGSLELNGGGYNQVAKQGTAALLNAGQGFYPYTKVEVINAVRTMFNSGTASLPSITVNGNTYAGGTFNSPEALASYLDMLNNLGCPLNNSGGKDKDEDKDKNKDKENSRRPGSDLGSSALNGEFAISGYPNPSKGNFNIRIDGSATENVSVRVTDLSGRLIEQRTNVPANQTLQIGTNYRAGMYYIEVSQGGAKKQLKIVKQ